ncbi:hypothetical protein Zm00014a_000093 [Zea mays]|uniref:DUF1639 family protein n=3 Tax=Zea mays TaxID=4577 RepID=K7UX23_MAIZE|nr:serine/arginine repetitive matrix protein 1 [Zea mays]AQK91966.1 DUF1639 family protein [Zea mays]PWZ10274.1 hypothetical protein Zm00014a_000093 [Zea mays]|eukprot:XP_008656010.1 serine/arginine repetitive matrix protein 1 [Zea mays]
MAATADPRAKPTAAAAHHLAVPWAHQASPAAHRMPPPVLAAAAGGGGCGARDRHRSSSAHRQVQAVGEDNPYDGGIEALRAKLMGHLRDAADRLRVPQPLWSLAASRPPYPRPPPPKAATASSPPPPGTDSEPELRAPPPLRPPTPAPPQAEAAVATATGRPWNLRERTRRRPASTRSWAASPPPPSSSSRRRRKRAPFSVSLKAEEIEEDIYALTGSRPRRRPRKRPRAVQRHVDSLFPGLWLTEITADAYRVPDE